MASTLTFPLLPGCLVPVLRELHFGFLRSALSFNLHVPTVNNPSLASIQSRPPPAV
jgi:hypothetical protein